MKTFLGLVGMAGLGLVIWGLTILVKESKQSDARRGLFEVSLRVKQAVRHVEQGRLRAADSLLFQCEVDLLTLSNRHWWTEEKSLAEAQRLTTAVGEANDGMKEQTSSLLQIVTTMAELVVQPDLGPAEAHLENCKKVAGEKVILLTGLSHVLVAVKEPDYDKALDGTKSLAKDLQDTTEARRKVALLQDSIKSRQTAMAAKKQAAMFATLTSIREAVALAKRANFTGAREALERIEPKEQPEVTAAADAIARIAAQDFPGAEAALRNADLKLPGDSLSQEIVATLSGLLNTERTSNKDRQATVAAEVRGLVNRSNPRETSDKHTLRGRAMVWDFTKDNVDQAYELLPDELRASSRDGNITMFCIRARKNEKVGTYSISGQPAYQEHMTIAVVYWPSKEYGGERVVLGGAPASVRKVRYSPEYGSSVQIKEWIAGLPRVERDPAAVAGVAVPVVAAAAAVAPPAPLVPTRTWKDRKGRPLSAELVSVAKNTAGLYEGTFRRADGQTFTYAIGELSDDDIALVKQVVGQKDGQQGGVGK